MGCLHRDVGSDWTEIPVLYECFEEDGVGSISVCGECHNAIESMGEDTK